MTYSYFGGSVKSTGLKDGTYSGYFREHWIAGQDHDILTGSIEDKTSVITWFKEMVYILLKFMFYVELQIMEN